MSPLQYAKVITVGMRQQADRGYEKSFQYKNQHYFIRRKFTFRQFQYSSPTIRVSVLEVNEVK